MRAVPIAAAPPGFSIMASIYPITSDSFFTPLPISALSGVSPSLPLIDELAILETFGTGRVDSSLVELSGPGRLLSAIATFREQVAGLQPGQAKSGLGRNFGNDLASLGAEAQYFVDAFNSLQLATDSAQSSFNAYGSGLLAGQIAATQAAQVAASYVNGDSALTRLEQLGIGFDSTSSATLTGRIGIDLATLRSAFASDPIGSFSLLADALDAFAAQADGYLGQAASVNSVFDSWNWPGDNFLLNGGLAIDNSVFGLSELLLLGSFDSFDSTSLLQRQLALDQFALVSSFL